MMLMLRPNWHSFIFIAAFLLISGCTSPFMSSTVTVAPSTVWSQPTATTELNATSTLEPTFEPTLTLVQTDTSEMLTQEVLPTPDLYEKNVEALFLGSIDITCEPACWHTIQPGISTIADTRDLLRDPFQFEDTDVVLEGDYYAEHPDLFAYGHNWLFDEGTSSSGFIFYAEGESVDDTIHALEIWWSGVINTTTTLQQYPTFQSIFALMGVPDKIYHDLFRERWMMIYFDLGVAIPIGAVYSEYQTSDICFDGPVPRAIIFITQPYSNDLNNLSDFQLEEVDDRLQTWRLQTVEGLFGITEPEFVDFVMDDTTVNCLEIIDEN